MGASATERDGSNERGAIERTVQRMVRHERGTKSRDARRRMQRIVERDERRKANER